MACSGKCFNSHSQFFNVKFLKSLLILTLLIPSPVLADHVPTQAAYGQDLTTDNAAGTITIGILGSDGFEDSPPENYTIFFSTSSGVTETNSFCVTTSFGHQDNTWQYYTFSNDDLKYYFDDLAGVNFYLELEVITKQIILFLL